MKILFHSATSCPQCRTYNPTTHKLYLSFEDSDENPTEINDLKVKLQSSNEKIEALYVQIREADVNFLHLQEECTSSTELIRQLEERILQFTDSESNFLNLQGQYTESENLLRELQENVQLLAIDNESKTKELNLKSLEIATLKTSLEAFESQSSDIILTDKIRFLEQKLKHLSAEFEKEITISTQLSIDKMKLESYIERMKLEANANESAKNKNANNSLVHSKEIKSNNSNVTNSKPHNLINQAARQMGGSPLLCAVLNAKENNLLNSSANSLKSLQSGDMADSDITSVVIKDYPLNQIFYPLQKVIITLAAIMDMTISEVDLGKVNIMERNKNRQLPKKVSLYVQFKSLDLKVKFLSNKNRLKNNPSTAFVIIKEYMDDLTYSVFTYANKKLRGNGFQFIISKNNQVIAKKNRHDPNGVRIYSRTQVDELLKSNSASSATLNPTTVPNKLYEDEVDECYYKK